MRGRRTTLAECAPRWVRYDGREPGAEFGPANALQFECPEAETADHIGCVQTIPVALQLDGTPNPRQAAGRVTWNRDGDDLSTVTLTPSIRCSGACRWHGFVTCGRIEFCGDSQAGPDWSKS